MQPAAEPNWVVLVLPVSAGAGAPKEKLREVDARAGPANCWLTLAIPGLGEGAPKEKPLVGGFVNGTGAALTE